MRRNSQFQLFFSILQTLGGPLFWGLSAYAGLFFLIQRGVITNDLLLRYLASHPVSYVATAMFFVGMAALCLKALDVLGQLTSLNQSTLGPAPQDGQAVEDAQQLIDQLDELPTSYRKTYLWRRLHDVLLFVRRKRSADGIDDELKYLSDLDVSRQHDSYALVRILIWATPMLGFLGTVIGISAALGGIQVGESQNFETMMQGLRSSLYVAFDTTALALTLSIVLMFFQFLVDRFETGLLSTVDLRVNAEFVGRFQEVGQSNDPHVKSIQRMGQAVVQASESLVQRQAELWQQSMQQAQQAWEQSAADSQRRVQSALAPALEKSLQVFADRLEESTKQAEHGVTHRWEQWQVALSEATRMMRDQQQEMVSQGEIMNQAIQATADIVKLEDALNRNLESLSGAKHFEDTVMSLAAAIHLLNTRLNGLTGTETQVELKKSDSPGRAA